MPGQAEAGARLEALQQELAVAESRLRGYEKLLGRSLSLRGVEICWREAGRRKVGPPDGLMMGLLVQQHGVLLGLLDAMQRW
jgi:hypothetical protein